MSKGDGDTVVEVITPTIAAKYLEGKVHNRTISQKHVNFLIQEMKESRWKFNGATIVFNKEGKLIDGQHRLYACLDSGVSIKTLVARNVDEDAFYTIDTGHSRTAADVLSIAGESSGSQLAAAVRFIVDYQRGTWSHKERRLSNAEIVKFVEDSPGLVESLDFVGRTGTGKRLLSTSVSGALHFLMAKKDRELADTLFRGIEKGFLTEDGVGQAFIALREKIIHDSLENRNRRTPPRLLAVFVIKAWNARRKNESLRVFRFVGGEQFPKIQ